MNIEFRVKRLGATVDSVDSQKTTRELLADRRKTIALRQRVGIEVDSVKRIAVHDPLSRLQGPAFASKQNIRLISVRNSLPTQSISPWA
jgi:hypothetical protein